MTKLYDNLYAEFSFTSREEYLEASKRWKADYAQRSANIRTTRAAFKAAQREVSKAELAFDGKPLWHLDYDNPARKAWVAASKPMAEAMYALRDQRRMAVLMLEVRSGMKCEAGNQRELRLQDEALKAA
jgi:hypothetical protein